MADTKYINVLSLCTGYGGLELALAAALEGVLRVVAVEIGAFALANLVAKAEEGKLDIEALYPDVKTFPRERFSGCFDIITAGYPCQPFSHAGKRQGVQDPRHLWPDIREHIRTIRPAMVLLENVAGHVSLGFKEVVYSLQCMGYSVEAGLFTAAEVGAPHKRERLFILAYNTSLGWAAWRPQSKGQCREACIARRCELADAEGNGIQASTKHGSRHRQELSSDGGTFSRWPSRPGQEQYEWEEPRTVEPGMGRTVDGFRSRVDELRLLGNGVVPMQAEKAIRYLFEANQ